MKLLSNNRIFSERENFQCHASSFLLLPDGGVLCVFFGGTREGADDVCIWGCTRSGGIWSDPVRLTENDGQPHWNPVLLRRRDGGITLFYKVGKPISDWRTERKKCAFCSTAQILGDLCRAEARELMPGDTGGGRGPVKNKAIYLSDGTLIAPASTEKSEWQAFFDLSQDDGETWERTDSLSIGVHERGRGVIQPSVWESDDGVHALLRSSEGRLCRSDSTDHGRRWRAPYSTSLPNNNSGIDLDRMTDGTLILAYNPVSGNWGRRSPLSLACSRDDGLTWTKALDLIAADGEYSYPAIQCRGRHIFVSYTYNRRSIAFAEAEL